ncbi:Coiled-coil domain-containing protein 130 [Psilocybe cubensis]|uniref:DUF572-domain-containing protein n=2 Tax=Psilocybe cubensis TaxID=181762 RepID=A0A8H7Y2K7_PSICU|nr:Coiled-coil domain-containing protein 130 [Psilocybe cubensis]KAH9481543.1 Coiled-coil domain-containing protein 130 [Psilocybe cubensis]
MQGFNKYYPPDYDPSQGSLNKVRGKHALGDRARKLDQGILITRFELPFNIWCGTCNNHIGMGVRYNAEKKKIGAYYSTPIYSFRCKCHLCDGWFEIQTDPKASNTRYVVTSGARQKDEDWNPEENGGFAVHDTEKEGAPVDPLAALEKITDAKTHMEKVQKPRIESLQNVSEHYNSDPYSLSLKVRKRFRENKKIELKKKQVDDNIKERYGLPATMSLLEDDDKAVEAAKSEWLKAKQDHDEREAKRRKTTLDITSLSSSGSSSRSLAKSLKIPASGSGSGSGSGSDALSLLRSKILRNTAKNSSAIRSIPSSSVLP